MLDKRYILDHAETVQQNCENRGVKADVGRFVELETRCRTLQQQIEELSRQANLVSKSIRKLTSKTALAEPVAPKMFLL